MIRGTTPTLRFTLPFNTSELTDVWITFAQNHKTIIEKTLDDCRCEDNVITLILSQKDTLILDDSYRVQIQIRAKTNGDNAIASVIFSETVKRILKDGEI